MPPTDPPTPVVLPEPAVLRMFELAAKSDAALAQNAEDRRRYVEVLKRVEALLQREEARELAHEKVRLESEAKEREGLKGWKLVLYSEPVRYLVTLAIGGLAAWAGLRYTGPNPPAQDVRHAEPDDPFLSVPADADADADPDEARPR